FPRRGPARHDRARAAGAAAEQQLVAVALNEADAVERNPETRHQHLRERRVMALAVIKRAGDDGDAAIRIEADAAHLLALRRGDFEIGADAAAADPAARAALGPAPLEALPIRGLQRVIEHGAEIAAVVVHVGRRLVRDRARRDVITAPQLELV